MENGPFVDIDDLQYFDLPMQHGDCPCRELLNDQREFPITSPMLVQSWLINRKSHQIPSLWNILVSWDDNIPNWMEKYNPNVPNHQPAIEPY